MEIEEIEEIKYEKNCNSNNSDLDSDLEGDNFLIVQENESDSFSDNDEPNESKNNNFWKDISEIEFS